MAANSLTKHECLEALRGAQATTALAIVALHAGNSYALYRDGSGKPFQQTSGMELLKNALHESYWKRQGRQYPHWLQEHFAVATGSSANFRSTTGTAESWLEAFLVASSYEGVNDYAESTGLMEKMRLHNWNTFAWLIRNCVFHNFLLERPRKQLTTPVVWRDLAITDEMFGKPLQRGSFFTQQHAFLLLDDMHDAVTKDFA